MNIKKILGLVCISMTVLSQERAHALRNDDDGDSLPVQRRPVSQPQHNFVLTPTAEYTIAPTVEIKPGVVADPVSIQPSYQPAVQPAVQPDVAAPTFDAPAGLQSANVASPPAATDADCLASAQAQRQIPPKMTSIIEECSIVSKGQSTYFYRTCLRQAADRLPAGTQQELKVKLTLKSKLENTANYCMADSGKNLSRMRGCMGGVVSQLDQAPVPDCRIPVDNAATTADTTAPSTEDRAPSSVGGNPGLAVSRAAR